MLCCRRRARKTPQKPAEEPSDGESSSTVVSLKDIGTFDPTVGDPAQPPEPLAKSSSSAATTKSESLW